jgi:CHAT domain-containing protein
MPTDSHADLAALLARLATLHSPAERGRFLRRHRRLRRAGVVEQIAAQVREHVRVSLQESLALAEAAIAIAEGLGEPAPLGHALRAKANVQYISGHNAEAVELHAQALEHFERAGAREEMGRTLSGMIQPLALLGQYDRALEAAERARMIFRAAGDARRLARVDLNAANLLHRQDRFAEALACYQRAHDQLLPFGDAEGIAVALHNMAVCLIMLNDFHRATEIYGQARAFCHQHGMPLLAGQADYNIAYLHYHRGEYGRAIEMLRAARETCERNGDLHHVALCHLDLAELYLELNLSEEAAEMAQGAIARFEQLRMGYEAAKAQAYLAIAASKQGKAFRALELFEKARARFVAEKNHVWPWLLDLYQALVLFNEGRLFEARRLASRALEFFASSQLPAKAALCRMLLARISLRSGHAGVARGECADALEELSRIESPVTHWQAHLLMSQIAEAEGCLEEAYQSCRAARQILESLRSSLRNEELKIAFLQNKGEVYESLVELSLRRAGPSAAGAEEAFACMEQAKSRSLRDLLFGQTHPLPPDGASQSALVRKIRDLREELNWFYHRIESAQLSKEEQAGERVAALQSQARARENEMLRVLRETPAQQTPAADFSLQAVAAVDLEQLRAALPEDAALVEYFRARDHLLAAVLTRDHLEITALTPVSRALNLLRLLQFQFSKFRLGPAYISRFYQSLLQATRTHLEELYQEILSPLRAGLHARHLVFVPHDLLHYVPFQSLFDGQRYLIDAYSISYAPSASILALCRSKPRAGAGRALVLGVPDERAPQILGEVEAVARILPDAELHVGAEASVAVLRDAGAASRTIHIATHGYFRQDNPLFSGIRLGDSYLSLYDLYQLRLPAEQITLSGCATGLNVLGAGDELLGLVRGLLYAGARTLLLTMWEVHDASTAKFMNLYYTQLQAGAHKSDALRQAMLALRESYPHPYFWSPFVLVGSPD